MPDEVFVSTAQGITGIGWKTRKIRVIKNIKKGGGYAYEREAGKKGKHRLQLAPKVTNRYHWEPLKARIL